jgi:hypothetical protein
MSGRRVPAPLIAETRRRVMEDRIAMIEPSSIEREAGEFGLACTTVFKVLEAERITEAHDVRADIAREHHSSRAPKQRDLAGAMPGSIDCFDATSNGQCFCIC